ncbi:MAG: glycosyltransferase family 2 protein [Leptospiraceae bacterium]|nr:glycosyltransferase family 2 protein [Leptospiraceae bacterium]MCB1304689.1 glycosyltransferase family 2 protein [Leptospiraceae bacterium]
MAESVLNIVIPMAGRGSRFATAGYELPKPLIEINGKPMIQIVVENLRPARDHRFIFLCLEDHLKEYDLKAKLSTIAPSSLVVEVDTVTEGAACTVLLAREFIANDQPLMIANSDQFVDIDIEDYLNAQTAANADGLIMTMKADDPKWSFVGFDQTGRIDRVVEKEVISNEATVGIYNYARGNDFVTAADRMIAKNIRVNNEFYVAPVYNEMIAEGKKIVHYDIGSVGDGMYGLGTPADLDAFLKTPVAQRL